MGFEIVAILCQYGANPNIKDLYDNSPLHSAAEFNIVKSVEILCKN